MRCDRWSILVVLIVAVGALAVEPVAFVAEHAVEERRIGQCLPVRQLGQVVESEVAFDLDVGGVSLVVVAVEVDGDGPVNADYPLPVLLAS